MNVGKFKFLLKILLCHLACFLLACEQPKQNSTPPQSNGSNYLNHSDSAKYVGMDACRQCHESIYSTFIQTGMGNSFDSATKKKSAANFDKATIYDHFSDFYYRALWKKDRLYISEYRMEGHDTVHHRQERVDYIIGSGQHTNSHMQNVNGYLTQMPMTFYTQKQKWDLPPGFENGVNTRFSRKIGLECMTCHNAYPTFVTGSENKYEKIQQGIDCERCHGPGSIHVAQRQSMERVDTSKYIDYSIVNPAKLPLERQFDICQRCHLQGNAVLKEGHSFLDFKPGQKLSDHISVFLPRYKNADDEFIMASHADRLKQSACFIKSLPKASGDSALRPYQGALTCITCHNPHVSVRQTNPNVFNEACLNCHSADLITEQHPNSKNKELNNCVSCHMPVSGSIDIPHVSVHDHYIRKPVSKKEFEKIKSFVGLRSINELNPSPITMAMAYIAQFEKFDQKPEYLDSAQFYLNRIPKLEKKFQAVIHLEFAAHRSKKIIEVVQQLKTQDIFQKYFLNKSIDNRQAWTAYRISEAYTAEGKIPDASKWMQKASDLAPYNLEFRSKLGALFARENKIKEAMAQYDFVLLENPNQVQAYTNLGYLQLSQGRQAEALRLYKKAYALEPDNSALLLNLAGYYLYVNDTESAKKYLKQILKKEPAHQQAKQILNQLQLNHV